MTGDQAVISLYAKGMTTGDIANHLGDIDGSQVSEDLVSRVTEAVVADITEWQTSPLERCSGVPLDQAGDARGAPGACGLVVT